MGVQRRWRCRHLLHLLQLSQRWNPLSSQRAAGARPSTRGTLLLSARATGSCPMTSPATSPGYVTLTRVCNSIQLPHIPSHMLPGLCNTFQQFALDTAREVDAAVILKTCHMQQPRSRHTRTIHSRLGNFEQCFRSATSTQCPKPGCETRSDPGLGPSGRDPHCLPLGASEPVFLGGAPQQTHGWGG